LVFHGDKRNEVFANLHVTESEWESMKGMQQILDGRIIECHKDEQGQWRYKKEPNGEPRFRDDKTEANHISTVESVLESIEDAVSEQDLLDNAKMINAQWKRREAEASRPQANGVPR
jgi:mRNA guanylyltransferase